MTETRRGMTCKELVELVTAYFENALPDAERARFERHLSDCEGCTAYIQQMRQTIRLVGRLAEDDLSLEASEALLHAFRDWKQS